uniref:Uncharacterized protein n=1 Tax=Knipowitschia caucasica TaxID=637954 RepID=A0AAV2KXM5_KNICA
MSELQAPHTIESTQLSHCVPCFKEELTQRRANNRLSGTSSQGPHGEGGSQEPNGESGSQGPHGESGSLDFTLKPALKDLTVVEGLLHYERSRRDGEM